MSAKLSLDLIQEPAAFRDPVCGMTVDPATARASVDFGGTTYYYCCPSCATRFRENPQRYLGGPTAGTAGDPVGGSTVAPPRMPTPPAQGPTLWICPMDPEVRQDHPGSCPKCGMALEPAAVTTAEEAPNPELADMSRRHWVGLVLALPVFLLAMGDMLPGQPLHHLLDMANDPTGSSSP